MPFCTACGRKNPDDARFCSQCGTRLVTADDSGEGPGESTATISIAAGQIECERHGREQPRRDQ